MMLPALLLLISLIPVPAPAGEDKTIGLPEALEGVKKNSLELSSASIALAMEEARFRMSPRLFFPSLSLDYSQNDSVLYDSPDSRTRRISVGIGLTVYDRGVRFHTLKVKKMDLRLKRLLLASREEELILETAGLYIAVLDYRLRREILEETLGLAREQSRIGEKELLLGEITEVNHLSLILREKDLELRLSRARAEEARLVFEFGKILGAQKGETLRPAGSIDPDYRGFLRPGDEERLIAEARKNSPDIGKRSLELYDLREVLRREERPYLPDVGLKAELSMTGRDFPLTRPGFSAALNLVWNTPVFPLSLGATAGRHSAFERSLASEGGIRAAENLEGLLSPETARANLGRAGAEFEAAVRNIEYSIREELAAAARDAADLELLRNKAELEEKKVGVMELRLRLGEIRRADFVEAQTALAETRIEVLSAVTALFRRETALLGLCGISGFGTYPLPVLPGGDLR